MVPQFKFFAGFLNWDSWMKSEMYNAIKNYILTFDFNFITNMFEAILWSYHCLYQSIFQIHLYQDINFSLLLCSYLEQSLSSYVPLPWILNNPHLPNDGVHHATTKTNFNPPFVDFLKYDHSPLTQAAQDCILLTNGIAVNSHSVLEWIWIKGPVPS